MMKFYRYILMFPILILTWGCYTTSQHPLVHFEDDQGEVNIFAINVYDECMDCHNTEPLEDLKAVHQPKVAELQNHNYDYYSDNNDLDEFYSNEPWWFEYKLDFRTISGEESEQAAIAVESGGEIIIERPPSMYPPAIISPGVPATPSKDRTNDTPAKPKTIDRTNGNEKKSDPSPRQRDGGGRGNSKGRR